MHISFGCTVFDESLNNFPGWNQTRHSSRGPRHSRIESVGQEGLRRRNSRRSRRWGDQSILRRGYFYTHFIHSRVLVGRYNCGNGKSLVISVIHFWKFCAGVPLSCYKSRNQVFPGILHVLLSNTLSLLFLNFLFFSSSSDQWRLSPVPQTRRQERGSVSPSSSSTTTIRLTRPSSRYLSLNLKKP